MTVLVIEELDSPSRNLFFYSKSNKNMLLLCLFYCPKPKCDEESVFCNVCVPFIVMWHLMLCMERLGIEVYSGSILPISPTTEKGASIATW